MRLDLPIPQGDDWKKWAAAILQQLADFEIDEYRLVLTGTVVQFAGRIAPFGWLLCDGTEYSSVVYPELARTIGGLYGSPTGTNFCVPGTSDLPTSPMMWVIKA